MKLRFAFLLLLSSVGGPALADSPLPLPEKFTVCSRDETVCAISDPAEGTTLVTQKASGKILWKIPGWHRWLFVSDDGESVVVGYDGMNLVPLDVTLDEPVLFFYHRGNLVRTVTLEYFYRSKSQLRRTVSHFAWGHIPGFNHANQLVVELDDGKKVAFSARTGLSEAIKPDDK